jgi:LuxR family maltose regulon positive regulatory protein
MGVSEFMWADFDRAYENIKIAYELSKKGKDIFLQTFILMVYTVLLVEMGDVEANKKSIELEDILKRISAPPMLTDMYIGWKIYLLISKGQMEDANKIISESGLSLEKEKSYSNEGAYTGYASLLLAQSKLDEAELLLSELHTLANEGKRVEKLIALKISYSILYKMRGDYEKAVANMIEAMEMAAGENVLYYFAMYRHLTNDILNESIRALATTKSKIPGKFVDDLKLARERWDRPSKNQHGLDLSARELETLKLIAKDLSNQEIADKLFISLNTVKTHLKNINLKLEVDNRARAVLKAKELGII